MYGISNSQQQGGGGGGAASYKAIKSTLTPSDWQEVAGATPYFVGDDATTWAIDSQTNLPMKTSNSDLGIIAGQQYTITIEANGVEYSSTATAGSSSGIQSLMFTFSETANAMVMIYDHVDWATKTPVNGSATMVNTGQNTSLVITNFAGEGFGTIIQATISDSAIKVNSAVTMYTNTSEKIAVGEKTNGNVTLIAPNIPETEISYSLEIVGTDTEGLFEIVNGYVPEIILPTVPQWHTIYEDATGTGVTSIEFSTTTFKQGDVYRIALDGDSYIFCLPYNAGDLEHKISIVNAVPVVAYNSVTYHIMTLLYTNRSLSTSYEVRYDITETGISNYEFSTAPELKFTKIEVYR